MLTNVTYQPFKVFALVALGYFILCYPLSRYSRYLENKFNASHHPLIRCRSTTATTMC